MKPETLIYDKVKLIILNNSDKTVFLLQSAIQVTKCFSIHILTKSLCNATPLAEQNILDENELDKTFEGIVNIIKSSKVYNAGKLNIATITLDKSGIRIITTLMLLFIK